MDDGLCSDCLYKMPPIGTIACPRCSLPGIYTVAECPDCRHLPDSFTQNISVWLNEGDAARVIQLFKFSSRIHLAKIFATVMVQKLIAAEHISVPCTEFDLITFVPMHPFSERNRGYNQARVLAEEIALIMGLECRGLLIKKDLTKAQHFLNREERLSPSRGAVFALADNDPTPYQRVLLVDDILTTGATVHFCSQKLLEGTVAEVTVLTLARQK